MNQYAQIINGIVSALSAEDGSTENDLWVFCSAGVAVGWQYSDFTFTPPPVPPPPPPTGLQVFLASVQAALYETDATMHRIQEAVSLGATTATTADVVAFVNYRRALRTLLTSTTVEILPIKTPYPVGT